MASTHKDPIPPPGVRDPSRRTIKSDLLGDSMTYNKYSWETEGAYTLLSATIRPGYDNPPHHHTLFTETFTCTSGVLNVTLDGATRQLHPGDSAHVPIGHVHSLINATDADVEFECKLEPGSQGFEQGMYIVHGMANDGLTNKDGIPSNPATLAVVAGMMDTTLAGWLFWLASPLVAVLRRSGQGWGLEKQVLDRYWYN